MEGFKRRKFEKPEDVLSKKEIDIVQELKAPIYEIAEQLSSEFRDGEYSVILGEDASGRLPTRIVGRVAQEFSRVYSHEAPIVRFFAGNSGLTEGERSEKLLLLKEQFEKMRETLQKEGRPIGKVLIVTEAVAHGNSTGLFVKALHEIGWAGDIAAVGIEAADPEYRRDYLQTDMDARIIFGMQGTPRVYKKGKRLSGTDKEPSDLFATERIATFPSWPSRDRKKQFAARDVADEVGYEIAAALIDEMPASIDRSEEAA